MNEAKNQRTKDRKELRRLAQKNREDNNNFFLELSGLPTPWEKAKAARKLRRVGKKRKPVTVPIDIFYNEESMRVLLDRS
jgi:hypothetical protein